MSETAGKVSKSELPLSESVFNTREERKGEEPVTVEHPFPDATDPSEDAKCYVSNIQLPETIYSLCCVMPIAYTWDEFMSNPIHLWMMFYAYFFAFVNILCQGAFVAHILMLVDLENGHCGKADPLLLYVAVAVYTVFLGNEIVECIEMTQWLFLFETVPKHEKLQLSHYEDDEFPEYTSGITSFTRMFIFVTVILPKFLIGIALLTFGLQLILVTDSNADVTYNCTALIFIVEVDEAIYQFFIPSGLRNTLEGLPPMQTNDYPSLHKVKHLSLVFWPLISFGATLIIVFGFGNLLCSTDPAGQIMDVVEELIEAVKEDL